ncbi:MAG: NFACT family protein, partial [Bacteroidota bacterium]
MPLDAPLFAAVAAEINPLLPVKIDRIHQPYAEEFILSCYGRGQSFKLLCSLHHRYARLHLYEGEIENQTNITPFGALLRKHFTGSKLINIIAVPFERILRLTFEVYEEPVGLSKKIVYLELTGKSSNLIVTDENGFILDLWRKSGSPQSRDREIAIDVKYEFPSTGGRWQPVTINRADFVALAAQLPPEVTPAKFLLKHWYGISTMMANEIVHDAGLKPDLPCSQYTETDFSELYDSFTNWADSVSNGSFKPCLLYNNEEKPVDCSALLIRHPESGFVVKPVPTVNLALAEAFGKREAGERFLELRNSLLKKVTNLIEKTRTKLGKQEQEAAQAEQGDEWRIRGELLTTYGSQIPKGSKSARLANHYDPNNSEVDIPLDPALSVWENAQHYFKKYQKAKKGQLAIAAQIEKTKESLDYLESLEAMLLNAANPADIKLIQEEWDQADDQHPKRKTASKKKEAPAEPRQFQTPAGHLLLVGRNNLQNDRLTFKIADPSDWWFHTQKIPGSHVILRPKPGISVDDDTLNFACQLAVYFSKGRESTKVPVDYTQRKYVKKPPGAKPGFVI